MQLDDVGRVAEFWQRRCPAALIAHGEDVAELLERHGFDIETATLGLLWAHDGPALAMIVLEALALMGLRGDGASGDVQFWLDQARLQADVLGLWVEALEERMVDEYRREAAERAAGVRRCQEPSATDCAAREARAAQCRAEDAHERETALGRRRLLIDAVRAERETRITGRIAELERQSKAFREL